MSSLKSLYQARLAEKQQAAEAAEAPLERVKGQLARLYHSIVDDRDFYESLHAEVELLDDDLRVDPGPVMIVVTALPSGDFRMEYEVKRSDSYEVTDLPEVKTIDEVEGALAKLLVEFRDED